MKKGPQRDWAERTAKRFVAKIYGNFLYGRREQDILTKLLRRAEKQGIIWAYNHYEQAELLVSGELSWAARERDRSEG